MSRKREAYFDNARFILITFVIFGHVIRPVIEENAILNSLYTTIYLFHMAGFILISGYFAKNFRRPGYLMKVAKKTLPTYVLFQTVFVIAYALTNGIETATDPSIWLSPRFTLWFLLSLFGWNVLLLIFTRFRRWPVLVAFGVGIAIGYLDINTFLSISRTLVFFPLFLLGYYLQPAFFRELRRRFWRIGSGCVLAVLLVTFYFYSPEHNTQWVSGAYSYAYTGIEGWYGVILRLIQYCLIVLSVFSVLSLIPNKSFKMTIWGTRTLYIYLLHGIIIQVIRNFFPESWYDYLADHILLLILLTLAIVLLLGNRWIPKVTRPFVEGKIFRKT